LGYNAAKDKTNGYSSDNSNINEDNSMSEIRFRLAKPIDAKSIAYVHWHVRDRYTTGIFLSLGKSFLRAYYKIVLNDPWEVVVCAVDENNKIIGFSSTTMDAKEQAENLKRHKFSLMLSALAAILKKPSLAIAVWQRYRSLSGSQNTPAFIHTEGARGEYWCWLKSEDSLKAIELSNVQNDILYDLGLREKFFEVDKFNTAVYKFHLKVNKAQPLEEMTLPDGRERVLMKKVLQHTLNRKSKQI